MQPLKSSIRTKQVQVPLAGACMHGAYGAVRCLMLGVAPVQ